MMTFLFGFEIAIDECLLLKDLIKIYQSLLLEGLC